MKYFRAFTVICTPQNTPIVNFRHLLPWFCSLILIAAIVSCSTKRDSTAARWYHNTTAHYNGYFNAEESVKKGVEKIRQTHQEDYDKILPIFIYGDENSAKASYPEMEKAIGKCEKVINRHTIKDENNKEKEKPKFNKWIDENYMVIGRAYFYKRSYARASETFNYVNRKFKDPEIVTSTNTWLARTFIQQGEYGKAIQALQRVEEDNKDMDEKLLADYHLVYADVYLHQGKLEKAATEIETSLKYTKRKRDRARPNFILAQIYQQLNRSNDALTYYEATIKSRPPYELEFYARINKALAYSRTGGSSNEIQKELFKMLKDEKNLSYRDQIYYALGDIAWEEQRRDDAVMYYEKSLEVNKENVRQRAKTFLRLADLYFDERKYVPSQAYYDSTLTKIDDKHERYEVIKARAESLNELVLNLNKIELYDSLGVICKLPAKEREAKIAAIQRDMQRKLDEQRVKDEEAAQAANNNAVAAINGSFWAYNDGLRKSGKSNFVDRWGERPLKDNWRLQSKLAQSFGPGEEIDPNAQAAEDPAAKGNDDKYKAPEVDELLSNLPCDDNAKLARMEKDAAEGYYMAGVIYKEKLDDEDYAISTWEELLTALETSDFHPTAYYQLYRTWYSKENSKGYINNPLCSTCNSAYWGNEIKRRYPDSDWAYLVDNPDYVDVKDIQKAEETKAYEIVYGLYANRDYLAARAACDSIISNEPSNHLLCKYRLLRAISVGYTEASYGEKEMYQKELNELVKSCPGTDEAKRAQDLLKAFKTGSTGVGENDNKEPTDGLEVKKEDENQGEQPTPENTESPYKYDEKAEHYMAVLIPVQGSDINKAKIAVSDFNSTFFASSQLKVTNNLLNKDQHLVLIKSFKVLDDGYNYLRTFDADEEKLKDINDGNSTLFLISKQNYITLFKTKDIAQYLAFYESNYQ